MSCPQLNFENNGPGLLFKTYYDIYSVSCHLLVRMARMEMDQKHEKLRQIFLVLMLSTKKAKKHNMGCYFFKNV